MILERIEWTEEPLVLIEATLVRLHRDGLSVAAVVMHTDCGVALLRSDAPRRVQSVTRWADAVLGLALTGIGHPLIEDHVVPIVFARDLEPNAVLFSNIGPSDSWHRGSHPDAPFAAG